MRRTRYATAARHAESSLTVLDDVPAQPRANVQGVVDECREGHQREQERAFRSEPVAQPAEHQTACRRAEQVRVGERVAEQRLKAEACRREGASGEEVRASLERQLVIARYLRERFAPIAFADEQVGQVRASLAQLHARLGLVVDTRYSFIALYDFHEITLAVAPLAWVGVVAFAAAWLVKGQTILKDVAPAI